MFPEKKKSLFKSFKFMGPGNTAARLGQILLVAIAGGRLSMGALTDVLPQVRTLWQSPSTVTGVMILIVLPLFFP